MAFSDLLNSLSFGVLGGQVLMASYNYLSAFRLEKAPPLAASPKASLLIPFRNEAENIPAFFDAIQGLNVESLEIIVLDDESTDETYSLLCAHSASHPLVKVLRGERIPESWVGKSWACHQLAAQATGDVLVFCDADVRLSARAVKNTLSWMENQCWDALTALPFQVMKNAYEKAIIPFVMHLPILGLVPLRWVSQLNTPSLVVANGQWFAIRRAAYFACGGHESVKHSLLEDMELARNLVRQGYRIAPVLATRDLAVRMYSSAKALKEGFTKNLYPLCGGTLAGGGGVLCLYFLTHAWPMASFKGLALLLVFRGVVCLSFSSGLLTVMFHPWGLVGFSALLVRSTWAYVRK
ncbi:MAG: glycosyltransferase, partial [Proteobacteria bacterium]|nr:glycosyltransferase [Pseudomonadota bacterium]